MTQPITEMTETETQLVSGGVTMSPDGKSCTDLRRDNLKSGLNQGGPAVVAVAGILGL